MSRRFKALLALLLLAAPPAAFAASLRLSDLGAGGSFSNATSDKIVTVRNGGGAAHPDVLTTLICASLTDSAASCATDATNAANISSGTLSYARLPAPTLVSAGGVQAFASASNGFLTGLSVAGTFISARPACGNLSDSATGCSTAVGTIATVNSPVPIANGGTGQTTANPAFNALSPMTTGGDIIFGSVGGVATRLAANAAATKQYLQTVSSGNPLWAQVAFSDLSGSATGAQLPTPTASTLGGVFSFASASNNFLTGLGTDGTFLSARPACANLSNAAASCSTDATVASNIASGQLPVAQLPALSSAKIWIGGTTNLAAEQALSGGATMTSAGVVTLGNPGAATKGGVQSFASASNAFLTGLTTSGVLISAQPAFTNLSGSATCAQEPALTGDATSSAGSCATTVAKINGATLGTTTATTGNLLVAGGSSWATTAMSGDATFISTGALTIAASAVTNAKMANMANNTVKSNVSGGSAAPSDNGVSAVLDVIGSTQGDVMFRSASTWQRLAAGTSGQFLQTAGAGANPLWANSGGGMLTYSDNGLTVTANTYYAPIGGSGALTTTEANVDVKSPSATTIANLQIDLSVAIGAGNTIAFTLRDATADTALTCTISGASATTCQDLTHSVNIAQNDLIDWKVVTTGTVVVSPTITIAASNGTSNVGVTAVTVGNGLQVANGSTTPKIDYDNPSQCDCRITLAQAYPKYVPAPQTAASVGSNIATFTNPHGWATGTIVIPLTTAGGLTHDVAYYTNALSTTTVSFYNTLASAIANTGVVTLSAAPSQLTPIGIQNKTLYLEPSNTGGMISLYDGSAHWKSYLLTEQSIALSGLGTTAPIDVFVYDNSGTPTLELLAWTSNNLRATALVAQNGVLVKSGATTRRWLGTIYAIASDTGADVWYGTVNNTGATVTVSPQLYVMNAYNKILRHAFTDPAYTNDNATTTYTTASTTWVTANGGTGSKIELLSDQINSIDVMVQMSAANSGANADRSGIGVDSTSDASLYTSKGLGSTLTDSQSERYINVLSEGYHAFNFLMNTGAGTMTVNADSRAGGNSFDIPLSYIEAEVWQ